MIGITHPRVALALLLCSAAPAAIAALNNAPATSPPYLVIETEHAKGMGDLGMSALVQYTVKHDTVTRTERVQFTHIPGEVPRGDISADDKVAYIVVQRDASRGTSDLLSIRGREISTWSTAAYPGSRPCGAPEGAAGGVYVTMGLPEGPGNNVQIAHFDATGAHHSVFASHALALHLIAVRPHDILVYRVDEERASLLTIARGNGTVLRETSVLGYARDFTTDGIHVLHSNRSPGDSQLWLAQSWDPSSGEIITLASSQEQSPIVFAGVALHRDSEAITYLTDRDGAHKWQAERETSAHGALMLRSTTDQRTWLLGNDRVELEGVGFAAGETLR